jgi:hypothetical protein
VATETGGGTPARGNVVAQNDEWRRTVATALGCSNLYGKNTGMQLGSRRTPRVDTGAATTAQNSGRRSAAAAQARWPRPGGAEHNDKNEQNQHAPYLAETSRAAFTAAEEQQTARARRRRGARVWRRAAWARLG